MIRSIILLLVLIATQMSYARSFKAEASKGKEYEEKADAFFNDGAYDSASYYSHEAMIFFQKEKIWPSYFYNAHLLGITYWHLEQMEEARILCDKTMLECKELIGDQSIEWAQINRVRGMVAEYTESLDTAMTFYQNSLQVFQNNPSIYHRSEVSGYTNVADVYQKMGLYEESINAGKLAAEIAQNKYGSAPHQIAKIYQKLAYSYSFIGEHTASEAYFEKALDIRMNLVDTQRDYLFVIILLNAMSESYFNRGMSLEALEKSQEAYKLASQHLGPNSSAAIYATINRGAAFIDLDSDSAVFHQSKAIRMMHEFLPTRVQALAESSLRLSQAFLQNGDLEKASKRFLKTIEITERLASKGKHHYAAYSYNALAMIAFQQAEYDKALSYFEEALNANVVAENIDAIQINTEINYLELDDLLETILGRVRVSKRLIDLGLDYETSLLDLLADLDVGITILNEVRTGLSFDFDRGSLSEKLNNFYCLAVTLTYEQLQIEGNSVNLQNRLLSYSENNKSYLLRAGISKKQSLASAGIPQTDLRRSADLNAEIKSLKAQLARSGEMSGAPAWNKLLNLNNQKRDHLKSLQDRFPKYTSLMGREWKLELSRIQQKMAENEAVIEYFSSDSYLYTIVITLHHAKILRTEMENDLEALIQDQIQHIEEIDLAGFNKSHHRLYKLLFEEIENYFDTAGLLVEKLTIIPDGMLGLVSFDVLVPDIKKDDYLFNKYIINYEPSIQIAFNRFRVSEYAPKFLLSFAPSFDDDSLAVSSPVSDPIDFDNSLSVREITRGALGPLPGALEEVKEVSKVFDGDMFLGSQATEVAFKDAASNYSILHLATHALADHEYPDNSKLLFSAVNEDEEEGNLHAYEIYDMQLNAQLVTLSACNTGLGKLQKGEGVMSLSRAFAYAGCPSTLVSLWPASDKSSPVIMTYFYQNLKDGQAKDVALNNARKQYLATAKGKARHPFYWGGFVLIGDSSPLEEDSNIPSWVIISILMIVVFLVLYWKKRQATVG